MGRIKKKTNNYTSHTGSVYKNLMERYFALKLKRLNFSETKKFSTESFLTLRELQPVVLINGFLIKKIRVSTKHKQLCTIVITRCYHQSVLL